MLAAILMSILILRLLALTIFFLRSNRDLNHVEYFEGTITYRGDFLRLTNKYDSIILKAFAGGTTTLYVKDGNYLTVADKGITTRSLYRKNENIYYRARFNSDTVFWTRCDQTGQKILKFTKRAKVERILGIDCDELKVYYQNKTVTYYYNSDTLKANPDWYKKSTSYHENFYSREMKAVNLKSIIEYKDFVIIQTAVEIKQEKLDVSLFEVPNKPLLEDK